ncbi:hypothetical protein BDV93DRAFT_546310 [Ceratobasidium sp. AG-I]|nr:hypothetical protein BDV93DRAFT_546310 [Ceratobasidium sp. AG-I]
MPGVICYRDRPQDCASLGHLYRSSPNAALVARSTRTEQKPSRVSVVPARFRTLASTRNSQNFRLGYSAAAVSLPLLLFLAPEVVLLVLEKLPGPDILCCRSSAKLQYIAEASARGLEPLRHSTPARLCVSRLFARERNWAMLGSISGTQLRLNRPEPDEVLRVIYDSGRLFVFNGSKILVYSLYGGRSPAVREYDLPEFNSLAGVEVIPFGDYIGFSILGAIHVFSIESGEVIQTLHVPRRGTVDSLRFHGDTVAALFYPERQSAGVLLWNWRLGKLIGLLHSDHFPTLSFTFLRHDKIVLVRTDRSAGSARLDTYTFGSSRATLRSSLALPDTHPTKWYAKAIIHGGETSFQPGSEPMQHDRGVLALDIELRARAPHDPSTVATNRNIALLLVVNKKALVDVPSDSVSNPVPWTKWSSGRHRILAEVRIAGQSVVWGHRIVGFQTGAEPGKVVLLDFCPVGVRAVSSVWSAGTKSWGGSRGIGSSGGVSVRAALAQRARTLVRASDPGFTRGWFEGMGQQSTQMPYVASVRRGMVDAQSVILDGERIVLMKGDGVEEDEPISVVTWFEFSV